MGKLEEMRRYIDQTGISQKSRYGMSIGEAIALAQDLPPLEAIDFAFRYGRAKGFRAAKAASLKQSGTT